MTAFLMIFWRFLTTFRRFPKIIFSKIVPKARWTFPKIFRKFLKIPEDVRRLPKTIKEEPKIFQWYTNYFKYNLRDKLDISEINIFTYEDIIIISTCEDIIIIFTCEDIVSFLWICYHLVCHWLLYNNRYGFNTFSNKMTWKISRLDLPPSA